MAKVKMVYVVTDGSYSDYGIQAVFSTKEKAEAYANKYGYRIEEFPLDQNIDRYLRGETFYTVIMDRQGNVTSQYDDSIVGEEETGFDRGWIQPEGKWIKILTVSRWAKDINKVVKITNEIRAMKIANNEWPEDV